MTGTQFFKIIRWQNEVFPKATALSKLCHLEKEIKEIKEELEKPIILDRETKERLSYEYADALFLIFGSAAKVGLTYNDLIISIDKKFEVNKNRDWNEPDADGVYLHKK